MLTLAILVAAGPHSIIPGLAIGQVSIGQTRESVVQTLGAPQHIGETAMRRQWDGWGAGWSCPWTGKPTGPAHELDVYFDGHRPFADRKPNDMAVMLVEQVRTTSPSFRTDRGIHVGSTEAEVTKAYRHLQFGRHGTTVLGDDPSLGITFELFEPPKGVGRCVAILVHPRHRSELEEYIPFYQVPFRTQL
jgi:hypothetical protein